MSKNWSTIFRRRLRILQLIPEKDFITKNELCGQLQKEWGEKDITEKMVKQDLADLTKFEEGDEEKDDFFKFLKPTDIGKLSTPLPIKKMNLKGNPKGDGSSLGYQWYPGTKQLLLADLTSDQAFILLMVKQFIEQSFPPEVVEQIGPLFNQASEVVKQKNARKSKNWLNNIVIEQRGMPLKRAEYDPIILGKINTALFEQKKIDIKSVNPMGDEQFIKNVQPLGLVIKEPKSYLIYSVFPDNVVKNVSLIRIKEVQITTAKCTRPDDFKIRDHIPGKINDTTIKLQLHILNPLIIQNLKENPIETEDGKLDWREMPKESYPQAEVLTCVVRNTHGLRQWILGLEQGAVVLKPAELRKEMRTLVDGMHKLYH